MESYRGQKKGEEQKWERSMYNESIIKIKVVYSKNKMDDPRER